MATATIAAPKFFRAATWPRERFYLSCDQRRAAGIAPHSWESDEPVADRAQRHRQGEAQNQVPLLRLRPFLSSERFSKIASHAPQPFLV